MGDALVALLIAAGFLAGFVAGWEALKWLTESEP